MDIKMEDNISQNNAFKLKQVNLYCRVCLELPQSTNILDVNIIYDEDECLTYKDVFKICTDIDLLADINLPNQLCKNCGLELQMAYDFHKKVNEAKSLLTQRLKEAEIQQQENEVSDTNFSVEQFEDAIKTERFDQLEEVESVEELENAADSEEGMPICPQTVLESSHTIFHNFDVGEEEHEEYDNYKITKYQEENQQCNIDIKKEAREKNIEDKAQETQQHNIEANEKDYAKKISLSKRPRLKSIFNYNIFKLIPTPSTSSNPTNTVIAHCTLCKDSTKTIKGTKGVSSNFIKHLQRWHPMEHKNYIEDRKQKIWQQIFKIDEKRDSKKASRLKRSCTNSIFNHNFFKLKPPPSPSSNIIIGHCVLCNDSTKTIKGTKGISSNFIKHLKRLHPMEYKIYIENKTQTNQQKNQQDNADNNEEEHREYIEDKTKKTQDSQQHNTDINEEEHKKYVENKAQQHKTTVDEEENKEYIEDKTKINQKENQHHSTAIPDVEHDLFFEHNTQKTRRKRQHHDDDIYKKVPLSKRPFLGSIFNYNFFKLRHTPSTSSNIVMAHCVLCKDNNKIIRGAKGVSSNFIKHLERWHLMEYKKYIEDKKKKTKSKNQKHNIDINEEQHKEHKKHFEDKTQESQQHNTDIDEAVHEEYIEDKTKVTQHEDQHYSTNFPDEAHEKYFKDNTQKIQQNKQHHNIKIYEEKYSEEFSLLKKPYPGSIFNYNFFKLKNTSSISSIPTNAVIAHCVLCNDSNKTIRSSKGISSNFIKHLKRLHPQQYKKYIEDRTMKSKHESKQDIINIEKEDCSKEASPAELPCSNTIFSHNFFKLMPPPSTSSNPPNTVIARCVLCKNSTKFIKGAKGISSNFIKHLKRLHPMEYQKYIECKSRKNVSIRAGFSKLCF